MFDLKKPCADCPFLKDSTMRKSLRPGRVKGIVEDLLSNDYTVFTCHKTIDYSKLDKDIWDESKEESFTHQPGNQMCMGSMIFLQKLGRPHVSQRLAYAMGKINYKKLEQQFDKVIDESDLKDDLAIEKSGYKAE